jgi:hypothetical protein
LETNKAADGDFVAELLGEQHEHVVEERNAGLDRGLASAVNVEFDGDLRFFGRTFDLADVVFYGRQLNRLEAEYKAQTSNQFLPRARVNAVVLFR